MKKIPNYILLVLLLLLFTTNLFSQVDLAGAVFDDFGSPIINAIVSEKGKENFVVTETDGNFVLGTRSTSGILEVSYDGFETKIIVFSKGGYLGGIQLIPEENTIDHILVVGKGLLDVSGGRKTPIAVSTVKSEEIQNKIGAEDVTATLINTPSVYISGQTGGFGESRISVRGFGQDNTAYLLNGQPINGVDDGSMYWSNWTGVTDITAAVQIQRGLGASKLAVSSVGGTTNFVVKPTENKESGYISGIIANNNYYKSTVFYNTGISKKGLAASFMFAHWQGDGYMQGNFADGQTYLISIGYKLNEEHNFNFLITGAPQQHDQAFSQKISTFLEKGKTFNSNWGTYKGKYMTERKNFYHKPVANINWDFNVSENVNLSSVLYASWGRGGGTKKLGSRIITSEGQIDYDAIYTTNKGSKS